MNELKQTASVWLGFCLFTVVFAILAGALPMLFSVNVLCTFATITLLAIAWFVLWIILPFSGDVVDAVMWLLRKISRVHNAVTRWMWGRK
jgi:hypothetical protein